MLIVIGGVVAGLLLGVFAALARDLLSGRLLESWQVQRELGLPVLAEFDQS
jgi:capsular polysaccharide biosynthesis protein